jgi:hypothetical protein
MFNFFKGSPKPKLLVTEEDKRWIESNFEWMMHQYGAKALLRPPVTTTQGPFSRYHNLIAESQQYYLEEVCIHMDVDPDEVALHSYVAGDNAGFDGPIHVNFESGYSQGEYHHRNNLTGKFDIHINQKITDNIQILLATMAHEVGHVKLLGEYRTTASDEMHEYVTDLTAIYYGFGILLANTVHTRDTWTDHKGYSGWSIGRSGYLPLEMRVHALAVQAYLQGEKDPIWTAALDKVPRKLFQQSLAWLYATGECDATLPQARGGRATDV